MVYYLGVLIPLLGFILQAYPRLINKSFGVDVWTRLLEIDAIRNANHRVPDKVEKGFIIEGHFDYPPVFPFIFSFFSRKTIIRFQGYISPLIDSFQTFFVFVFCYQITNSLAMSLLAQLIYILTPMIAVENSYLTPRSLGYLTFTLAFYPLILNQLNPSNLTLLSGVIFAVLLFLTHRFALQSYVILCLLMGALTGSLHFFAIPVVSFILAVTITKGYYLRVLKGHLSNIYFWVINYKYRFAHQIYGLRESKKNDWVAVVYKLLSEFSPIFLLFTNVWAASAFVFIYLYVGTNIFQDAPVLVYFAFWVAFCYILGAIILRFKVLIPIGEGQRYLEMATLPSAILTSYLAFYFYGIYGTIVIFLGGFILASNLALILYIQIKGVINDKNRSLTPELEKMYSFINRLPEKRPRIMCIPHQITTMTVFHTKADVLVNADNPGLMKLSDFYPILNVDLQTLQKKYQLDYILLRENFAKEKDLPISKTQTIFTSGDIQLLKF